MNLSGFRNHADTRLELPPGLVVFQGDNGQGKSSLLEAAYLLAIAKSPRASSDRELVNWDVAKAGGHVQVLGVGREGDTTVQAQVDIDVPPAGGFTANGGGQAAKKSLRVNGIIRSAADFVGKLNVVYFEANDLQMVYGGPGERRRFLDILISQTDSAYLKSLQRYSRVVMQRNQLLRRVREDAAGEDELEFWDDRLSVEGAAIVEKRRRTVAALRLHVVAEHARLTAAAEQIDITYTPRTGVDTGTGEPPLEGPGLPTDRLAELLSRGLAAVRSREIAQGVSLIGPHRDDLAVTLDGRAAETYASRGQARSIALSMKLAEAEIVRAAAGRAPVLALDDVLSELDGTRRRLVLDRTASHEQTLLTVTDFSLAAASAGAPAARFTVCAGKVAPVA